MTLFKRAIAAVARRPLKWRQDLGFRLALASVQAGDQVVFIDIDNTLADSWPTLTPGRSFESEGARLKSLRPLSGTIRFLTREFGAARLWVFLSHRPLRHSRVTRLWLKAAGIWRTGSVLCLVEGVHEKLAYLEFGVRRTKNVSFIDDLSYGHEHGKVRFYDDVIRQAIALGVDYHGRATIEEVNR